MTPPAKNSLGDLVKNTSVPLTLEFIYTFRRLVCFGFFFLFYFYSLLFLNNYFFVRQQPPGSEILFGKSQTTLDTEQRQKLSEMIFSTNQTQQVVIPNLIPRLYNLPISGSVSTPDSNNLDIILALNRTITTERVTNDNLAATEEIDVLLPYWFISNRNVSQHYVDDEDDSIHLNPQLVVLSAEVPSLFGGSLAASGIVGLCKFVFFY